MSGWLKPIVSRYFLESDSAKKFRNFILENSEIIEIIDFGNNQVFDGVNVLTSILILRKKLKPKKTYILKVIKLKDKQSPLVIQNIQNINENKGIELIELKQTELSSEIWSFYPKNVAKLIKKIEELANISDRSK